MHEKTADEDVLQRRRVHMKKSVLNEKMLEALCCFLKGVKVTWEDGMTAEDWRDLFRLSRHHQILPMILDSVYGCRAFETFPPQDVQAVKSQVIRQVMIQSRKTEEFLSVYNKLLKAGLRPLVVKGIICRNMYREPDYRSSGDEDVLIQNDEFRNCHDIFLSSGMRPLNPGEDPEKEGEVPYCQENGVLHIELHKELFASGSEAYGDLNDLFSGVFDRAVCEEIRGQEVYTMAPTDHLLYLILHAFKHFLHSGFGIRQVCDIVLFAEKFGREIDWEKILEDCRKIHADVFAASLFDIGKRVLNFDPDKAGYPESWTSAAADGTELLDDLLDGGVFGDSSMSRKHSSNITLQAVAENRKGKKAGPALLHSLFPERRYMERNYGYLQKYPFLLPAAWVSRIGKYLKETRNMEKNNAAESIEIGNHRVDLMKKYKIIQ